MPRGALGIFLVFELLAADVVQLLYPVKYLQKQIRRSLFHRVNLPRRPQPNRAKRSLWYWGRCARRLWCRYKSFSESPEDLKIECKVPLGKSLAWNGTVARLPFDSLKRM